MLAKLKNFAGAALVLPLLAVYGYCSLFSNFVGFDDEGYILQSVRAYLEHGELYRQVYSQYGPAFYVLLDGLHRLTGVAIDHSFARWMTLALWIGCAGGMAWMVMRATASRMWALFAFVASFLWLHLQGLDPFHPGAVIRLVVAGLFAALAGLVSRGRLVAAAGWAGAAVAVLALLKINVGLLLAAGLLLWLVLSARGLPAAVRAGVVAATGLFAVVLMHTLVREPWVQIYLVVFGVGLLALSLVIRPETNFPRSVVLAFAAGAGMAALAVLIPVMVRGTGATDLVEGIFLGPSRHAANYAFPPDWRPGTVLLAGVALLALRWHRQLHAEGRTEAADRWLATLRLLHYLGLGAALIGLIEYRVIGVVFSFAVPWLWIWIVPLGAAPGQRPAGVVRDFTACAVLLQFLQAYPVGAIQVAAGTFPLFALAALSAGETVDWLRARASWNAIGRVLGPALLVLAVGKLAIVTVVAAQNFSRNRELALLGATGMRLNPGQAAACETMSFNAALHADRLYSLPGMFSFNLWSGVPSPTLRNTTVWYTLLGEAEQKEIARTLESSPRACLIVDRNMLAALEGGGFPPRGPLVDYLRAGFRPAFSLSGLDFWVKQGRAIAPAGTFQMRRDPNGSVTYQACLAGANESIAGLAPADGEGRALQTIAATSGARVIVQPIRPDGSLRGPAYQATWPLRFAGLAWITVECPAASSPNGEPALLLLQGDSDQHLGAAVRAEIYQAPAPTG